MRRINYLFAPILLMLSWGLQAQNTYNIIPKPLTLVPKTGKFSFSRGTRIIVASKDATMIAMGQYLADKIKASSGLNLKISYAEVPPKNAVMISLDPKITNNEGYELSIANGVIYISAKESVGIFYALQTLNQLMAVENNTVFVPQVEIKDSPRFVYRGLMLDVGRHFFPIDFIKKMIDVMAMYKFNTFHWHLTEDQGWRIEIKKYPKLTEVGAYRKETIVGHNSDTPTRFDGKRYGGFYTQEQAKEIVRYAAERYITVIPEIELPGHASAAIAAYPELGCGTKPVEVVTRWGVFNDVFCPTETTFSFLQDVIDEIVPIFPSKYIHIGGDECPKVAWKESQFCQDLIKKEGLKDEHELQSYFIKRIEKHINAKGKKLIGWDEILEGGLSPNATVMSWRGIAGGIEAAKQGHDVIMTPTTNCYLDYYQSQSPDEPLAIGGFLSLEKVYNYDPIPSELTAKEAKFVLGTQGNLWTEYIETPEKAEYMLFPRAIAIAENAWSSPQNKNYDDFANRLSKNFKLLDKIKVNHADHLNEVKFSVKSSGDGAINTTLETRFPTKIYYTTDGSIPSLSSMLYQNPIRLTKDQTIKAMAFVDNKAASSVATKTFLMHKAAGRPIEIVEAAHKSYNTGGNDILLDGTMGNDTKHNENWLGFEVKDVEETIKMDGVSTYSSLNARFFHGVRQWIYLPKTIEVFTSTDGITYQKVGETRVETPKMGKTVSATVTFTPTNAPYLKIKINQFGIIPQGAPGAGEKSFLFLDELIVK